MQDVHFLLFLCVCVQHVIGPFFDTQRTWLFEIFKPIWYQMSHTTKGVFFIIIILWGPFFQRILIIGNIQTHFILDRSYNESVCLFVCFFSFLDVQVCKK
jgi:hypothetical protein